MKCFSDSRKYLSTIIVVVPLLFVTLSICLSISCYPYPSEYLLSLHRFLCTFNNKISCVVIVEVKYGFIINWIPSLDELSEDTLWLGNLKHNPWSHWHYFPLDKSNKAWCGPILTGGRKTIYYFSVNGIFSINPNKIHPPQNIFVRVWYLKLYLNQHFNKHCIVM